MSPDRASRRAASAAPPAGILASLRQVFMVDDEEDILFVARTEFAAHLPAATLHTFDDPSAALDALRAATPDLLITDLRMPKLSGIELIWFAREAAPALPIVVVSAYGTPELRAEIGRKGSIEFVEKPFTTEALLAAAERAAARSRPEAGALSGQVSLSNVVDLVQLYAMSRSTGRLQVRHDDGTVDLWLERGDVVDATLGGARGGDAVFAALGWSGGSFSFHTDEAAPARTIDLPWQQLLLEGCRLLDESNRPADEEADTPPPAPEPVRTAASEPQPAEGSLTMANVKETLQRLNAIDGYVGACVVDSNSGMMLGGDGGGSVNLEVAAAGNTEVVRAKRKTMASLGIKDTIEDILITLGKQYHLIRPLSQREGLFIYLVLDKQKSNLAMSRHQLAAAEAEIVI